MSDVEYTIINPQANTEISESSSEPAAPSFQLSDMQLASLRVQLGKVQKRLERRKQEIQNRKKKNRKKEKLAKASRKRNW